MRKFLFILFFIAVCPAAYAGYVPYHIEWKGWAVASSEGEYEKTDCSLYPLTYAFDGDPKTAWVFSGKGRRIRYEQPKYALEISRYCCARSHKGLEEEVKPVEVDRLRIMNGYNRSKTLFYKNNRITRMKVYINGKLIESVRLTDEMGWHDISLPHCSLKQIFLVFTGFARGDYNNICISEIELYNGEQKVDMQMPEAVLFTEGSPRKTFSLISRDGKVIVPNYGEAPPIWNLTGRCVAGRDMDKDSREWKLWVANVWTGKLIYHEKIVDGTSSTKPTWKDDNTVILPLEQDGKRREKYVVLVGTLD